MATYIVLANLTGSPAPAARSDATADKPPEDAASHIRRLMDSAGVQVHDLWWTLGPHDLVAVFESAPDDITKALMALANVLDVQTITLTAIDTRQDLVDDAQALSDGHLRGGHLRGGVTPTGR
jgi:uncharacterized protein with GYD domain